MLKEGSATEANPIMAKLFNHDPVKTGVGAAVSGIGMMLARKALRDKGGMYGKIADMLAGQIGAEQTNLGIQNLQSTYVPYPGAVQRRIDTRNGFQRSSERQREAVVGLRKD
jgi:hypothetical protein